MSLLQEIRKISDDKIAEVRTDLLMSGLRKYIALQEHGIRTIKSCSKSKLIDHIVKNMELDLNELKANISMQTVEKLGKEMGRDES